MFCRCSMLVWLFWIQFQKGFNKYVYLFRIYVCIYLTLLPVFHNLIIYFGIITFFCFCVTFCPLKHCRCSLWDRIPKCAKIRSTTNPLQLGQKESVSFACSMYALVLWNPVMYHHHHDFFLIQPTTHTQHKLRAGNTRDSLSASTVVNRR